MWWRPLSSEASFNSKSSASIRSNQEDKWWTWLYNFSTPRAFCKCMLCNFAISLIITNYVYSIRLLCWHGASIRINNSIGAERKIYSVLAFNNFSTLGRKLACVVFEWLCMCWDIESWHITFRNRSERNNVNLLLNAEMCSFEDFSLSKLVSFLPSTSHISPSIETISGWMAQLSRKLL